VVVDYRTLIEGAVERDTRKFGTFEAFQRATSDKVAKSEPNEREISLRTFADKRRAYLLQKTDPAEAPKSEKRENREKDSARSED
jgi:hypothetical protein